MMSFCYCIGCVFLIGDFGVVAWREIGNLLGTLKVNLNPIEAIMRKVDQVEDSLVNNGRGNPKKAIGETA